VLKDPRPSALGRIACNRGRSLTTGFRAARQTVPPRSSLPRMGIQRPTLQRAAPVIDRESLQWSTRWVLSNFRQLQRVVSAGSAPRGIFGSRAISVSMLTVEAIASRTSGAPRTCIAWVRFRAPNWWRREHQSASNQTRLSPISLSFETDLHGYGLCAFATNYLLRSPNDVLERISPAVKPNGRLEAAQR
jgi:hypothetical protein